MQGGQAQVTKFLSLFTARELELLLLLLLAAAAADVGGKNDVELLSPDALSCLLLPLFPSILP